MLTLSHWLAAAYEYISSHLLLDVTHHPSSVCYRRQLPGRWRPSCQPVTQRCVLTPCDSCFLTTKRGTSAWIFLSGYRWWLCCSLQIIKSVLGGLCSVAFCVLLGQWQGGWSTLVSWKRSLDRSQISQAVRWACACRGSQAGSRCVMTSKCLLAIRHFTCSIPGTFAIKMCCVLDTRAACASRAC